jgi:two-component system, NtrC family, sensor kinase
VRVTYKLTLAWVIGITLVLAVDGYFRLQRQVVLFETDMRRDASLMGRTLAGLVNQVWQSEGERRVVELLERTSRGDADVSIRWVWIDEVPGGAHPHAPAAVAEGLLAGEASVVHAEHREGAEALFTYVRVPEVGGGRAGAIEVRESLALREAYLRKTLRNVTLTSAAMFMFALATAVVAGTRFVGKPMERLVTMARRVGAGDLTARAGLTQDDEIGELAREMDAMCERLAQAFERIEREMTGRVTAVEQLRHADRLATVGQLAAGLAHELGTPLNVVSGRARLIAEAPGASPVATENAGIICEQAARMAAIIRQLLDFGRRGGSAKAALDLRAPVQSTADMLSKVAEKAGVTLVIEGARPVEANVNAVQIEQVFANLVVNAVQAMPGGGPLRISVERTERTPPGGTAARAVARVSFADQGVGIAPEALPRVFEPFFTTKEPGQGTGLGLSVAHGIVTEHGGWITIESELGRGSTFDVFLPLHEEAAK